MSRTKKTIINTSVGLACTAISSILSFVLQAVFIRLLGLEYSGINTLFGDILKILNIAELGINNAILFRLYKTINDNDIAGTEKYLSIYRKICYIVGIIVGAVGVCFIPFLGSLVKEVPKFPESLWSLYIIVLITSVVRHFLDYKSIYLMAKQDRYINTIIQYICIFLKHGLQIFVLAVFKNIYLYLLAELFTTILRGVVTGFVSDRKYHISWKSKERLLPEERKSIAKDVGSLAAYKVCRTLDATIDTFLISKFVAVASSAIYGSISMLLGALNELLGTLNDGMASGIGDLYASGDRKRTAEVFYQSFHVTFLLYGVSAATLAPFISKFTVWWIGHTLDDISVWTMLLNFYMYGFGLFIATYRNSLGLFVKGWKRPAVTALLNLVFSFLLVRKIGLLGTLLGTLIARAFTLVWYDPFIILKYGMEEKTLKYYIRYITYMIITFAVSVVNILIAKILPEMNTFISLLYHGVIFATVSLTIHLLVGSIFNEQKTVISRLKGFLSAKLK